eukprot:214373_1
MPQKRKTKTKKIKTDSDCCNTREQLTLKNSKDGRIQCCTFNNAINPISMLIRMQKYSCIQLKKTIVYVINEYKHECGCVSYEIITVCAVLLSLFILFNNII